MMRARAILWAAGVATALACASEAWADPPPAEPVESEVRRLAERQAATEMRLEKQQQEIARLQYALAEQVEENRRVRESTAAAPRLLDPVLRAVRLSGFLQADAVLHRQSSQDELSPAGAPLNQDRFAIPRAHLRVDAEKWILSAAFELEASTLSGPAVRAVEASLSIKWQGPDAKGPPLLMGTLGLMKIPFGYEVPELDPHRLFLERSTTGRALFPGTYDLGFRLQGGYRFLRYAVALTNGEPIGERSFPAQDPNAAKDLVGRVGVDTSIVRSVQVRAGISALSGTGFSKGTPATKDVLVWRDANEDGLVQLSEIQVIPGAPAIASRTYHRFALGADLGVTARLPVLGELVVYGEITRAGNLDRAVEPADPAFAGRDLRELGFYVGVTQELTRWGMIGARFDRYDPDSDASEQRGLHRVPRSSASSTLALTGALRYAPGRLIFEYDHNANALSRTTGGLPTSLVDDAFTLRGEVTF